MRYVAINTAGPIIEAAVVYDETKFYRKLSKVMAAEQLLPTIDEVLTEAGRTLADFDDFVCVVGPGSFTGIRIGVNTVRAFAFALNKNAYGVTYNRLMAYNAIKGAVVTAADGGGGTCYVAVYDGDRTVCEPQCIYQKDLISFSERFNAPVISDFPSEGALYAPDGAAMMSAAEYAINNKSGTDPVYIRKPQPDRKENDL